MKRFTLEAKSEITTVICQSRRRLRKQFGLWFSILMLRITFVSFLSLGFSIPLNFFVITCWKQSFFILCFLSFSGPRLWAQHATYRVRSTRRHRFSGVRDGHFASYQAVTPKCFSEFFCTTGNVLPEKSQLSCACLPSPFYAMLPCLYFVSYRWALFETFGENGNQNAFL